MPYRRCPLCAQHWYDARAEGADGVACAICGGHLTVICQAAPVAWWTVPTRVTSAPLSPWRFPFYTVTLLRPDGSPQWSITFDGVFYAAKHGAWPGVLFDG